MLANCPPSNLHKTLLKNLKECAEFKTLAIKTSGKGGKALKKDYITALKTLKKDTKPKSKSKPTYSEMIIAAISVGDSRKGLSRQAIKAYILANYAIDTEAVRKRLLVLLKDENLEKLGLVKVGGSYKLSPAKKTQLMKKKVAKKVGEKKKVSKKLSGEKKPVKKKEGEKKVTKKPSGEKKPVKKKEDEKKVTKKPSVEKKAPKKPSGEKKPMKKKEGEKKVPKKPSGEKKPLKKEGEKKKVSKKPSAETKSTPTKPKPGRKGLSPASKKAKEEERIRKLEEKEAERVRKLQEKNVAKAEKERAKLMKMIEKDDKKRAKAEAKGEAKTKKPRKKTIKSPRKTKAQANAEYAKYLAWKPPAIERLKKSPSVLTQLQNSPSVTFYDEPKKLKKPSWMCSKSVVGDRKNNEDRCVAVEFANNVRFYAVLDGHGGCKPGQDAPDAVDYFKEALPKEILKEIHATYSKSHLSTMKHRITQAFIKVDKDWFDTYATVRSGCTVTAVLDINTPEGKLYTINLGDSVTYVQTKDKLFRTKDHDFRSAQERERATKAGFKLRKDGDEIRVVVEYDGMEGAINLSRALGDRMFKTFRGSKTYVGHQAPISPIPDVEQYDRASVQKVALVCDGIVNGLDSGNLDRKLISEGCDKIISRVEEEQPLGKDNLTVMIVNMK